MQNTTAQLILETLPLAGGEERAFEQPGWWFAGIGSGVGYCLAGDGVRELATNDLMIVPPKRKVVIRASQIGSLTLHHFQFFPESLAGLLTLFERRAIETNAILRMPGIQRLQAETPLALEFAEICDARNQVTALILRCRLLALAAEVFEPELAVCAPTPESPNGALPRFQVLLRQLPELEIIQLSPGELARKCGCSIRHFARLFRTHFGISLRQKQNELRLQKARQLLCESDSKVINVALDSGFRHLSLFNSMFKKQFGMTPTELRKKKRRGNGRTSVLSALALWLGLAALGTSLIAAETAPTPAPAPATNAVTFQVKYYQVNGNTVLPKAVMEEALFKHTGPAVTLDEIKKALGDLQATYLARGFATVGVTLPQQQLTNGVVQVRVVEAPLVNIRIEGNHHFSSNNIMAALPSLRTNILLNSLVFQQELDQANANKDRQLYPVLAPGPEPGTSALNLKVKDRFPLHGRVEINNASTPGTPELRVNTALQYNNLWQLEHQAGIQYSFNPSEFRSKTAFPDFYNNPLIANYSGFYRMPLNFGEPQPRDTSLSTFGYDEVTKRFRPPALTGHPEMIFYASRSDSDTGIHRGPANVVADTAVARFVTQDVGQDLTVNENIGTRVIWPLPEFKKIRSSLSGGVDFKTYELTSRNTNTFTTITKISPNPGEPPPDPTTTAFAQPVTHNQVYYLPLSLTWDAMVPDKWGVTTISWNHSMNFGLLDGDSKFRKAGYSTNSTALYYVMNGSVSREIKLPSDWGIRVKVDGQWASTSLLNNEQFGIGGASGVRGYRDGQEYGDTGWRVMLEPHTPIMDVGFVDGTMPIYVRLSAFTDYAQRYLLEASPGRASSQSMWGVGLGLTATIAERWELRSYVAWALLNTPLIQSGNARVGISASLQF